VVFGIRKTCILFHDATVPSIIGFTSPAENIGIVDSWGYELSLKWNDKLGKDFLYRAGNVGDISSVSDSGY
jgi:hypothetical protein